MSQALLGRTLQILIICKKSEFRDFLEQSILALGHTVVAALVASKAQRVVDECLKLSVVPQLVLCDITSTDLLDRIHNVFKERKVLVPFVVIAQHPNHSEILQCTSRYYFMGCYYETAVTQDQLALAVLMAVNKFATILEYAQATEHAQAQLAQRKVIEKAKGYLMRLCQLPEDKAHHHLEKLAAQNQLSLYEQALATTEACEKNICPPKK